jgi:hypothetical protein
MNATEAVGLIEEDVNHAPQDAVVYAISRARLAKAVQLALEGSRRMAKSILDAEAETGLIGTGSWVGRMMKQHELEDQETFHSSDA